MNEIETRQKAVDCHQKIQTAAALAQQNIWEMCSALKAMRDEKYYKFFGYANFEEYCKEEHGITRQQAYKYCKIAENVQENVNPGLHLGVRKLYLLATLSEPEQAEIINTVDVENTTVKQLEAEIRNLRSSNDQKKSEIQSLNAQLKNSREVSNRRYEQLNEERRRLESDKAQLEFTNDTLENEIHSLEERIEELENRPVEVAVQQSDDSEELRQLKIRHKAMCDDYDRMIDQIQDENEDALRSLRDEYNGKIKALENQLENSSGTEENELEVLNVYAKTAHDAFERLSAFAKNAADKSVCYSRMMDLIQNFNEMSRAVIYG